MKNLLLFIVTFFYFLPAVAETALECNLYRICPDDHSCKTFEDSKESELIYINDDFTSLKIKYHSIFSGEYLFGREDETHYSGYKISDLSTEDLKLLKEKRLKLKNKEITKEEYKNTMFLRIFRGFIQEFYLDNFILNLKLKIVHRFPDSSHDKAVYDYKCTKTEKKI